MTNLLKETLQCLDTNGKSPSDVKYVVSFQLVTDWKSFERNANFYYNNGYGHNEISLNLKIVGDNWWLEREEYDGSEWWEFKTKPYLDEFRTAKPHEIMKMIIS